MQHLKTMNLRLFQTILRPLYFVTILTLNFAISSCFNLKPITKNIAVQSLNNSLSKFNGDYEVYSIDTSFRNLEFALTYSDKIKFDTVELKYEKVNLKAIDKKRIQVSVFKRDSIIKTKIIKGYISQNYFNFRISRLSSIKPVYVILNAFATQRNRIALLDNGNLTLDTNGGGFLLLVFVPTFGGGAEFYNLNFKRKIGSD